MTLQQLVQSGNYASAQEAFDAITTQTVDVRDDQLYTWAGVALIGGPVAAESLRIALEQNGMGWAVHQLGGSGLQLSNPLVQGALLQLAQAGVPGCAELAATGISMKAPWVVDGIDEPTLQDVQAVWDTLQILPTDTIEKQILVSINASPGKVLATATITELTMRNGEVIQRSKPEVLMNGTLIDLVTPVIEALRNG
jgi:hypothetical protein